MIEVALLFHCTWGFLDMLPSSCQLPASAGTLIWQMFSCNSAYLGESVLPTSALLHTQAHRSSKLSSLSPHALDDLNMSHRPG